MSTHDIAIVGGGLSGTIAAIMLGRAGYSVALIDRNQDFPAEFRVEKIGGDQVVKMQRMGLLPILAASAAPIDQIVSMHRGRILDRNNDRTYGIFYQDLVTAMRRAMPPSVQFIAGRVVDLATTADRQTVTIADHGTIDARLVVLASGMSDILRTRLGIEREVLREKQSLTFGFNIRPVGADRFPFQAITYYGERPSDGIDYFHFFPAGNTIRTNLFTFVDHRHPWVKTLRADPRTAINSALPGLRRLVGDFEVIDKVQNWIMDVGVARNVRQPGIVLIGDAYQTSCPAAGTGVSRLLTDIERLVAHVPDWLATPGMDTAKIATFYDDPEKQAMDARALAMADFRRSLTIDTGLAWTARRRSQYLRRSALYSIEGVSPALARTLRTMIRRA
jgi:2-polyprenyl-6-methoxyphenol hydroxylase-like FAD-dependent oxidoreductase